MNYINMYANKAIIISCVLILFFCENNKSLFFIILFGTGAIIFIIAYILFFKERYYFKNKLSAREFNKFDYLLIIHNPIKFTNEQKIALGKERDERLKNISIQRAEKFILYENIIDKLSWTFAVFYVILFSKIVAILNNK